MSSVPLLILLGLLMYLWVYLFCICKASTVPHPFFVPYLKISQDTKLPETSFLSVLILLHILPYVALLLQVTFVVQSGVFQPGAWVVPTQMV